MKRFFYSWYVAAKSKMPSFLCFFAASNILKSWREHQSEEKGLAPGKGLTVNDIAKAIGERYESVYRIERGGGSAAVLMKYLMLIRQYDKSFDLEKELRELKHGDYPTFTL